MSASISALSTLSLTGDSLNTNLITAEGFSVPLDAVMDVYASVFIIAAFFMLFFCFFEVVAIAISYLWHKVRSEIKSLNREKERGDHND